MRNTTPQARQYSLAEIVEHDSVYRFCESFARLHGLSLALVDRDGTELVRAQAPEVLCNLMEQQQVCDGKVSSRIAALVDPDSGQLLQRRECRCGLSHEVQEIRLQGVLLGWFVAGPYRPEGASGLQARLVMVLEDAGVTETSPLFRMILDRLGRMEPLPPAEFGSLVTTLGDAVGVLLRDGYERCITARSHMAAIQEAYNQLAEKNQRLAESVDELKSLDRMKSAFLATVSHELRTPLTSIVGYSEMLLEGMAGALAPVQTEYLQVIMEKGEQLMQIISEVLDISKIETGKTDLRMEWIDLGEVIREVVEAKVHEIQNRNLAVSSSLSHGLPMVWADKAKIRQVLLNLLSNAVKFTPSCGSVDIRAEQRNAGAPVEPDCASADVQIRISDSGIGIPQEHHEQIFEAFFQVDSSSTREYGGTGLGLAIVRNFVEAHGGQVWLDPAVGTGATFIVLLPVKPGHGGTPS